VAHHWYIPEWKVAIYEVCQLQSVLADAVGNAQCLALKLNHLPMTIYEEAMVNQDKAPASFHWEANDTPNVNDLWAWQFIQIVINQMQQHKQYSTMCSVLEDAILHDNMWSAHAPPNLPQSSGIVDKAFPDEVDIRPVEMVTHLINCRVRMSNIQGLLHPWILCCNTTNQAIAHSALALTGAPPAQPVAGPS
jgi:hypothetical protein